MAYRSELSDYKQGATTARCCDCKKSKSVTLFSASRRRKSGLQSACKACAAERSAERRSALADDCLCKACLLTKTPSKFLYSKLTDSGLDEVCKMCAPILLEEKGVARGDALVKLTPEEIVALRVLGAMGAKEAGRLKVDWLWVVERMEKFGFNRTTALKRRFEVKEMDGSSVLVLVKRKVGAK
jgi:hypothetical protein